MRPAVIQEWTVSQTEPTARAKCIAFAIGMYSAPLLNDGVTHVAPWIVGPSWR